MTQTNLLGEIVSVLLKNTEPSWWEAWVQLQSTAHIPLNPLRILKPATHFPATSEMDPWLIDDFGLVGEKKRKTPFFFMVKAMVSGHLQELSGLSAQV